MPTDPADASILVVDDETSVADGYALRLRSKYDQVDTAYGGTETIQFLDGNDVDVVLLDRRMPNMSGDEVLEEVQAEGYDCRVIMVTAVDPDFDIVEMDFDDYLQKPIEKEDLFAAVEQQLRADDFDDDLSRYFNVTSKIAILEADKSSTQLEDNKKYHRLKEEAERLERELDEEMDEFDDVAVMFTSIDRA